MGTLWVARHLGAGSLVAIKFMAPDISWAESARARFRREAWAASRIDSPHVVQVFDHGVHDEQLFLVMELLDGEDLSSRLKRCGALPLREAAWVLVQAARGLAQAHELGIVHRDLKPANLFLARGPGAVETVKILDFGIAKALFDGGAGDPTATGEILGSPEYMSPEQALGNAVDHRSDLWSLALVLYRMLAGRNAYEGQGISALLSMLQGGAPPLSGVVAGLPILLDRFFERGLARDTAHRFQSAQELAAATALIAGLPVDEPSFERPARSALSETDELPSLALLLGNSPSTVPPRSGLVRRDGADDEDDDEADQPTRVDRKRERREDGTLVSGDTGPQGAPQISTKDPASRRGR